MVTSGEKSEAEDGSEGDVNAADITSKSTQTQASLNYDINKPWETLDDWQKEYIATEGNCFLLCGRQSGKTAAMSIKFGERAVKRPNRVILMIALTEKQAYNLFFKTQMYIQARYPKEILKGAKKPTKHEINLKNGSRIMCYAAGETGLGLKGYTVTDLVIDEAAAMHDEVFVSCEPMISVTKGTIDLSSTPRGKQGFFYKCSKRSDFKKFYISAEDCPRHSKEFLKAKKETMTKLSYAQEYLAIFLDELKQFFPDELIRSVMVIQRNVSFQHPAESPPCYLGDNYLGVDVARLGEDECVFASGHRKSDALIQIDLDVSKHTRITDTIDKIKILDKKFDYMRQGIFIDTGGVGGGVFDVLLRDDQTKRKVVSIDNATKALVPDETRRKKRLKEDLYTNLKILMEQGKIQLFNDEDLFLSLKSVQYEVTDGETKIFGNYTHIAEAITRMAACMLEKRLGLWIR